MPNVPSPMGENPTKRTLQEEIYAYHNMGFTCWSMSRVINTYSSKDIIHTSDEQLRAFGNEISKYGDYRLTNCINKSHPGHLFFIASSKDGNSIFMEGYLWQDPWAL